jgi:hypothetical protein
MTLAHYLDAVTARVEAAKQEVFALCRGRHNGGREWTMCIPVHDTDSDRVLIAGLEANRRLVQGLRLAVEAVEVWLNQPHEVGDEQMKELLAALDALMTEDLRNG